MTNFSNALSFKLKACLEVYNNYCVVTPD